MRFPRLIVMAASRHLPLVPCWLCLPSGPFLTTPLVSCADMVSDVPRMMCDCDGIMRSTFRCGFVFEWCKLGDEESKPEAEVPSMYMTV